jgi:NADPH-dependent curcumin reductase CurA
VVGTVGSEAKAAVASEVLGVQRVVRYKEESLEDVLEAEFSGKVNVAYEGVGGPLLGAVCKQLAPGGQVLIVGSISQYPHNTHNAQKQKEKESNNVAEAEAEAEAEAASSVPAHGIPGLEDLDIMADVFRPRKTLDLPSGEGRQLIGNVWGDSFTSGVLPTITEKIYADHAGGTLAALVDETRRFEGVAAAPAAVAHMLAGGNTGKVVVYVSSTA